MSVIRMKAAAALESLSRYVKSHRLEIAAKKRSRFVQSLRTVERLENRDLLAGVTMESFAANGNTQLTLNYQVTAPTSSLAIGFYRSVDAAFGGDTLLRTITLNTPDDLSVGAHTKTLTIGSGVGQVPLPGAGASEVASDYYLLAVANPTSPESDGVAVFSGVYHPAGGGVFIHGRDLADNLIIDSNYQVTLNGLVQQYVATDVTSFRVRAHAGNDLINGSTAAKAIWASGGAGDDSMLGGSAVDTFLGDGGNDILTGGGGSDSLNGGQDDDRYIVSGTGMGADVIRDSGTLGVDRLLAGAVNTRIFLGSSFSKSLTGLEEISSNGFAGMSLIGTAGVDSLSLAGIVTSGVTLIDASAAADVLVGSDGGDSMTGGVGNDSLDGGLGIDTANFAGAYASYTVTVVGSSLQVLDREPTVSGDDGTDTLVNFEYIKFSDALISVLSIVNNAPVAVADTATIAEDAGAVLIPVLNNDTDVDATDSKRMVSVSSPAVRGTVQIATSGVMFYPSRAYEFLKAGESVVETFAYTMADAAGAQSTTSVVVTITGANDAPVAVTDVATVSEDAGATVLNVLGNDTDVDLGDSKSIVSFNGAGYPGGWELVCIYGVCAPLAYPGVPAVQGTVSIATDGQSLSYTPGTALQYLGAGATSTERFTYTIADAAGALSTTWVTLTISGLNDAPIARPDSLSIAKNAAPISISVLSNDTDVDTADTKTIVGINARTASIAADGKSILYTVGGAFAGLTPEQTADEIFTYTMSDAAGAMSTSTVTIRVSGSNSSPVAVADVGSATENGAPVTIDVLANDTDADLGDTKTIVSVSSVGLLGAVSIAAGGTSVIYTVGNAFQSLAAGAVATEVFSYTMRDAGGAQSTTQVTMTIAGANDNPVAVANTATTSEDGIPIVIDVLANDSDVDVGDTKQVVSVLANGLQGTVSVAPDGANVIYAVGGAFQQLKQGAIATEVFSYTMRDSSGGLSTANVTVTITGVNDSPVAVENAFSVSEDAAATTFAVLTNDTDPDAADTKRVVSINTAGLAGTATIAANGTGVVYSVGNAYQHLVAGQTATTTFTYTMSDSAGALSAAQVTVTIVGATDGPKAINDSVSTAEDATTFSIQVLSNDFNDLNPGDALTITSISGEGIYTTPRLGFFDGAPQFIGFNPGFPRLLGRAEISADGRSILYTPLQSLNAGETGVDTFKYTITGAGGTSTGTVVVTVTGANDAPIAVGDTATIAANAGPRVINVLGNDTDADTRIDPPMQPIPPGPFSELTFDPTPADVPDTKTVVNVDTTGLQGTVTIAAGGTGVIYSVGGNLLTLPFGATAVETFTYTMQDALGVQSTATVTVNVTGINQSPVAVDDVATAVENGAPITISVLANDNDFDVPFGDQLALLSINSAGLQGSVAMDGTNIVYTIGNAFQSLRAGVLATEVFSYTMRDSGGLESTARVTITVSGTNDAPVAIANSLSLSEDAPPTSIAVLANDTDIDAGDTKVVVLVNTVGLQGTVAIAAGGTSVTYTVAPAFQALNAGQTATETFAYTMVDSFGAQSTATVTITIIGANEPVDFVNPPPPPAGAIVGTAADDILVSSTAADIIYGMAGDDSINSGAGADTIFGGVGRDTIDGGAGNDIINGGSDRDDLTGGTGADVFRYYLASESTAAATDRIRDFNASEGDKIDLSLIDANYLVGGNNSFVVASSFTGVAGQLLIVNLGAGLFHVRGDVNGDGVADLQIEVKSRVALLASDLIL